MQKKQVWVPLLPSMVLLPKHFVAPEPLMPLLVLPVIRQREMRIVGAFGLGVPEVTPMPLLAIVEFSGAPEPEVY